MLVYIVDRVAEPDLDTERDEPFVRSSGEVFGERAQDPLVAIDEHDPRLSRIDAAEF
jgi:hypothetical protein